MPRVEASYKLRRRQQILDAARTCFIRSGFARTTLQDVFAEAGLSAGAVYNYFRSKEELILAIAADRHERERSVMASARATQEPLEALRELARAFARSYLSDAAVGDGRISLLTWSEALLNPGILASVIEGLDEPRRWLIEVIGRAQEAGMIPEDLDPDPIARSLIALLHGLVLQKLWDPAFELDPQLELFERALEFLSARER